MAENENKPNGPPARYWWLAIASIPLGVLTAIAGFVMAVNAGKEPRPESILFAIMMYGGLAISIASFFWIGIRLMQNRRR